MRYPFGMLMPGRRGYNSSTGWNSGSPGSMLPANPSYSGRSGNTPLEYRATESIEFIPGFESGEGDMFEAYITQGSSGGDGSELAGSGIYRYGFNGKENDNEVKGEGNQQDYGMRIYDARLGKFLSVDPLQKQYPELTTYQFASNSPIQAVDLDGLEKFHYTLVRGDKGKSHLKLERVENFTESKTTWSPTWTNPFATTTTTTINPRKEFIVHGTAEYALGLDGTMGNYESNFTWTFDSESKIREAESHGGPSNYGGWSWGNSDQSTATALTIGLFNATEAELELGGSRGSWRSGAKANLEATPTAKTNNAASSAHGGNTQAANANNSAKPTITYEGQSYEVKAVVPYERPNNATTPAQRKAVNQPSSTCATCGTTKGPFIADHKTPLAIEHISTGTIDKKKMRTLEAVQSQCEACSLDQSKKVRQASQEANKIIKNKQNGNSGG